jgi:hypothetical protein
MRKVTKFGAGGGLAAAGLGMLVASGVFTASAAIVVGPGAPPASAGAGLTRFDSCDELLSWYRTEGQRRVDAYGWDGDRSVYYAMEDTTSGMAEARSASPSSGTDIAVGSSETGTNIQEAGVDEPDRAKTDGTLLVRVVGHSVLLSDVTGDHPRALGSYLLPDSVFDAEVMLVGDRVVVTATGVRAVGGPVDEGWGVRRTGPAVSQSRVLVLDVSDPSRPALVTDRTYSGTVLSARQYGDTIRLVTQTPAPSLRFVYPSDGTDETRALAKNRALVRTSTLDDWLPTVSSGSGSGNGTGEREPLVGCDEVLHPRQGSGAGTIAVIGFDVDTPDDRSTVAVTAGGDTVYSSTERLYVATTEYSTSLISRLGSRIVGGPAQPTARTDVHEFDLRGVGASYTASGSVRGVLKDRWSLDEHDGHLRLAIETGSPFATDDGADRRGANAIVTMARDGDRLVESGRVDGLGRGEQIKSVRWFDDLAVVVTFRQMDPLYTVDLSDPEHPRLRGELKIPGFSGYLHPIGHDRLLGVGIDATSQGRARGAQVSVFDVSDLAHPVQVDRYGYAGQSNLAASEDPRAFTWVPGADGAGVGWTQVQDYTEAATFRLSRIAADSAGHLSVTTSVRPGLEPWDGGRVLPLPDGRVLLVAGPDATILPG